MRKQDYVRDLIHFGIGFLAGVVFNVALGCGPGAPPVTADEAAQITDTGAKIAKCQAVGRDTKSYRGYECCMIAAGLTPGAACSPAVLAHPAQDASLPPVSPADAGGPNG